MTTSETTTKTTVDYKQAGVDIEAGNQAVERIKSHVEKTHTPQVLTGLGGFGSLYSIKNIINDYDDPVLVQSIDGVGTKTIVANMACHYESLGRDLFAAACNDIVVMGAKPLTFLDYIAFDKLNPTIVEELVTGMAGACADCGVSLVGGETAEMPNVYLPNEIDLVGVITGVVEKSKIINGADIVAGDTVYALNSSGLHTNGFSLARKIIFDIGNFDIFDTPDALQKKSVQEYSGNKSTIASHLLAHHINYTNPVQDVLNAGIAIKGMAHITGGGVMENIPRIMPDGLTVTLDTTAWKTPAIFDFIQRIGGVDSLEMHHAFNMGVGLVFIGNNNIADPLHAVIANHPNLTLYTIGKVVAGNKVTLTNL